MRYKDEDQGCDGCSVCEKSLFKALDKKSLDLISEHKTRFRFKKGQIIFNESNVPNGVFAINTGSVKLYKEGKGSKEHIMRFAGPGAILGYRAIMCNESFGISAKALENVDLCFVPRNEFLDLVDNNIGFAKELLRELALELGETRDQIMSITQKCVRERIAGALLNLKVFYGLEADSEFLNKKISRTNLAQLTGTSLESVVRILKELKEAGLIDLDGKRIRISEPEKLKNLAECI